MILVYLFISDRKRNYVFRIWIFEKAKASSKNPWFENRIMENNNCLLVFQSIFFNDMYGKKHLSYFHRVMGPDHVHLTSRPKVIWHSNLAQNKNWKWLGNFSFLLRAASCKKLTRKNKLIRKNKSTRKQILYLKMWFLVNLFFLVDLFFSY